MHHYSIDTLNPCGGLGVNQQAVSTVNGWKHGIAVGRDHDQAGRLQAQFFRQEGSGKLYGMAYAFFTCPSKAGRGSGIVINDGNGRGEPGLTCPEPFDGDAKLP